MKDPQCFWCDDIIDFLVTGKVQCRNCRDELGSVS